MELLTAIVPIGPSHLTSNRINSWTKAANSVSTQLKIIFIEDHGIVGDVSQEPTERYPNFENKHVIVGNFGSPGLARNAGLSLVATPWFCFWDSDDQPNIEIIIELIKNKNDSNCEILVGNFERCSVDKELKYPTRNPGSISSLAIDPGIWRMIFRSLQILPAQFENFRMAEDQLFLLDINFSERNICFSTNLIYSYMVDGFSQLSKNKSALMEIPTLIVRILEKMEQKLIHRGKFQSLVLARLFLSGFKNGRPKDSLKLGKNFLKSLKLLGKYSFWFLFECFRAPIARLK